MPSEQVAPVRPSFSHPSLNAQAYDNRYGAVCCRDCGYNWSTHSLSIHRLPRFCPAGENGRFQREIASLGRNFIGTDGATDAVDRPNTRCINCDYSWGEHHGTECPPILPPDMRASLRTSSGAEWIDDNLNPAQGTRVSPMRRPARKEANGLKGIFPGEVIRSVRKFGIEIEMTHLDKRAFQEDMSKYNIPYGDTTRRGSEHGENGAWILKGDGSVHGMALELISPPMCGPKGIAEVKFVMGLLNANQAKVDESCGLHVHHHASDLDDNHLKNLLIVWYKYQDLMYMIADPRRETSQYCRKLEESDFRRVVGLKRGFAAQVRTWSRYQGLNFESLNRHGTVEFRLLEGTLNTEKVEAWVSLTQRLVLLAKHTKRPIKPNKVKDQVQLLGAITKMLSRHCMSASEREEQAFLILSRAYHANKQKRKAETAGAI